MVSLISCVSRITLPTPTYICPWLVSFASFRPTSHPALAHNAVCCRWLWTLLLTNRCHPDHWPARPWLIKTVSCLELTCLSIRPLCGLLPRTHRDQLTMDCEINKYITLFSWGDVLLISAKFLLVDFADSNIKARFHTVIFSIFISPNNSIHQDEQPTKTILLPFIKCFLRFILN